MKYTWYTSDSIVCKACGTAIRFSYTAKGKYIEHCSVCKVRFPLTVSKQIIDKRIIY